MFVRLVFFILTHTNTRCDTLHLPFYNGKILQSASDSSLFCSRRIGLCILPTVDFGIRSCSYGAVRKIWKVDGYEGYEIMVASKDTFYTYSMVDEVKVKVGQSIPKGGLIGKKKNVNSVDNFIIFSIFKNNKELNEMYILKKYYSG